MGIEIYTVTGWIAERFWISFPGFFFLLILVIFSSGFEAGSDFFSGIVHNCLVQFKMVDDNAAFLEKG